MLALPERSQRLHDASVDVPYRQIANLVEQRHQTEFAVDDGQFDVVRAQLGVAVKQFFVDVAKMALEPGLFVHFAAVVELLHAIYVAFGGRDETAKMFETS